MWDAVVIGGGAGLQGALSLARGQRRVVVVDAGPPQNARAVHLNNFVTRDGVPPAEFRRAGRAELATYGVEVVQVHTDAQTFAAANVLLTLGMDDVFPELPGLADVHAPGLGDLGGLSRSPRLVVCSTPLST